jgi:ferredoxin
MSNEQDKPVTSKDQQTSDSTDTSVTYAEEPWFMDEPSRRTFFKRVAIGGGGALLAGGASYGLAVNSVRGKVSPDYPVLDDKLFKPKDQRDVILNFVSSKALNEKQPERNEQYNRLQHKEFDWVNGIKDMYSKPWDNSKPGYTQKDRALQKAGWEPLEAAGSRTTANLQPNTPFNSWDQSGVEKEQYQFENKKAASDAIKSAARVFGAVKCGIARRDKRWDYDPLYDIDNETELSWENDFPFEPKTVIVMLASMDYDCMATAPAWTADGTAADGYSQMGVKATQMAKFLHGLGYHAVGAGNDLGSSVPYALIAPGVGPRVRIMKVYTDFEFVEYDQPHTWGITEFCLSCGKCADACPSDAIPLMESENGGYGFEPNYEFSDEPGYTWNNHLGIKKFYSDAKKCYNFWVENGSACAACIASCTFNEPDFWHHFFIMAINPYSPKILHAAMAESHPAFGYGHTNDPEKVKKFWKTGEGMRTNIKMKNNIGTSNKS